MKSTKVATTCHIARLVDKQGPRPSVRNQAEVEKLASGTNSTHQTENICAETRAHNSTQPEEPSRRQNERVRKKWTRDEYKEVMKAYYKACEIPNVPSVTAETYNQWRKEHPRIRPNMDANKLANVRRDIVNRKRLSEVELEDMKSQVVLQFRLQAYRDQDQNPEQDDQPRDYVVHIDERAEMPVEQEQDREHNNENTQVEVLK